MKKLFLIFILLIAFVKADVFQDLFSGLNIVNPDKKYYGGIDKDEMTVKMMFVKENVSNVAGATTYIEQGFSITGYSNYTITAGKTFLPLRLIVSKYNVTTDLDTVLRITTITRASTTNTNTIAEFVIPKGGEVVYEMNYPISVSDPASTSSSSVEVWITLVNTTNFDASISAMLYGVEVDS